MTDTEYQAFPAYPTHDKSHLLPKEQENTQFAKNPQGRNISIIDIFPTTETPGLSTMQNNGNHPHLPSFFSN